MGSLCDLDAELVERKSQHDVRWRSMSSSSLISMGRNQKEGQMEWKCLMALSGRDRDSAHTSRKIQRSEPLNLYGDGENPNVI